MEGISNLGSSVTTFELARLNLCLKPSMVGCMQVQFSLGFRLARPKDSQNHPWCNEPWSLLKKYLTASRLSFFPFFAIFVRETCPPLQLYSYIFIMRDLRQLALQMLQLWQWETEGSEHNFHDKAAAEGNHSRHFWWQSRPMAKHWTETFVAENG